jgi:hypothetical protein
VMILMLFAMASVVESVLDQPLSCKTQFPTSFR